MDQARACLKNAFCQTCGPVRNCAEITHDKYLSK